MFDLSEWFENEFWPTYNAKYCGGGNNKGPKSKALQSAQKKITSPEMATKIMLALREQIKYYKKAQSLGEWQANFPMAVTWLNQERWTNEIESHAELTEKHESKYCQHPACNKETHGYHFQYCTLHQARLNQNKEKIIESLKEKGLMKLKEESMQEWQRRQLNYVRERLGSIGK